MLSRERRVLTPEQVRAVLAETAGDPVLHARVALAALVGARPREVEGLRRADFDPSVPRLRLGAGGRVRSVRVAASAAKLLEGVSGRAHHGVGESLPMLDRWGPVRVVQAVRSASRAAGIEAGIHDLRQSAIAVVLEDGTPVAHVERYFGIARSAGRRDLLPVRDGYDTGIADVLQEAFG